MASVLSNYFGNVILHEYFNDSYSRYISLHTGDPGVNGDLGTEVVGGGYLRQGTKWNWATVGSKTISNTDSIIFHDLPLCTVTWLGIWNSSSGGQFIVRLHLDDALVQPASSQLVIPVGDIAFTI